MKRFIIVFLTVYLSASVCSANDLWRDTQRRDLFDITQTFRNHISTVHYLGDEVKETTVNLDRTLFGRAQNHNDIDIANQVKNAWSQGYTGQGVSIGILDFMDRRARSTHLRLNGVNSLSSRFLNIDLTVRYRNPARQARQLNFTVNLNTTNNGTFSGSYKHWEKTALVLGGRHEDSDGTVLYGIAKDANLTFLDANNQNRAGQFTSRRFDFINASFSYIVPTNRMTTLYRAIDRSNTYEHGKLPVYITSARNYYYTFGTATYQGIAQGNLYMVDYNAVDMVMSDAVIDGRPLSDYLLIVGSFSNLGRGRYDNLANRPGEVVELQNRWLSAPYKFPHDAGNLYGTSYSAPFVAGIAGIVKSKFPELTPADVANILLETAKDVGAPGTDAVFGRGLVDLENALSPQ
ncbi:MAG: S8 family serine peptidase [Desulfobacterales bacterium]|nr:S8 family serine peptidase [Desulfobacterales bacterium]